MNNELKLIKKLTEKDGKKYVNFYLVLPNGKRVPIKPSFNERVSDFVRLCDFATLEK